MNKIDSFDGSNEIAISVENVSKTFKIPHEKHTTLKGSVVGLIHNENKGYEIFNALKSVTFNVKKGEFFGIIGRNGSGKSTILKILAGIYVPDRNGGKVTIKGKLSPFLELGVGFNPELTGRENVFLGGAILGLTKKEIQNKFDSIVGFAELEEFIDMKFKNYSSGMQVRLAFSLAINARAEILLMDEVLAVGDINFQNKCLAEFEKYKKAGKTVVLVTHDIGTVQRHCDRAMLIDRGAIKMIDSAEKVGNYYFEKIIENEDKRLKSTETIKREKETADRIVIKKIDFYNEEDEVTNTFFTGKSLKVRVYFDNPDNEKELNFGVSVFDNYDNYIFGVNTFDDKQKTEEFISREYFEISYKNIPLRSGEYYVKVAIRNKDNSRNYDYVERSQDFKIYTQDNRGGLVNIDYKWV